MEDTDRVPGSDGIDRGFRVLIVEDDALIAMDAETTLIEAGHVVVGIAASEDSAVALALRTEPDVMLLDLRLAQGGCGRRVAERLAGRVRTAIVFASGNLTPEIRTRLSVLAPAAMLSKPYLPEQLVQAVALSA